jgi:hypothetical protein
MMMGRLKKKSSELLVHPLGERELDFKFQPAGGQFLLRGSDEALAAYVTDLTPEEADAFQVILLYRQRADAEWSGAKCWCCRSGGDAKFLSRAVKCWSSPRR